MGNDDGDSAAPKQPALTNGRPHLICLSGENVGHVYDLKGVTILGRHNGVDIPVPDAKVSRHHLEIRLLNGVAKLADLGSRNGTYVNNQIVREMELQEGDQLRLGGGTVMKFSWGAELASGVREPLVATVSELRSAQLRLVQSEKLVAVCQLGSGVAHEIINPLSAVMHNLSFVDGELQKAAGRLGDTGTELLSAVRDARDGASRIRRIVSDLQEFSWQAHDEREQLDLQLVVEDAIRLTHDTIAQRAQLERDFHAAPKVMANARRLAQVFVYLFNNAAEAIPPGAPDRNRVSVGVATDMLGRAVVEVRDSGVGIGEDILHKIFDPFFTTKSFGKGTGLSLAMAQGIVTALGGEISVESQPGQGTVFRVILPAVHQRDEAPALVTVTPIKLLLVGDDELRPAAEVGTALGHTVIRLRSAEEALGRIRNGERFDLVLLPLFGVEHDGSASYEQLTEMHSEQLRRVVLVVPRDLNAVQEDQLGRLAQARLSLPLEKVRLTRLIPQWLRLWED
ncbi:MAG: ATP-binding protein [Myxococcaceae bacterium]